MDYYSEIKNELVKREEYNKVKDSSKNRNDIMTYFKVGKLLIEAQGGEERAKYGNGLIKEYSEKLTKDLGKKYNSTVLKRARQFYLIIQKGATLSHQITWSSYCDLIPLENVNEINYYIDITKKDNLSVRELRERIKNGEYNRLSDRAKKKLVNKEELSLEESIKDPILIKSDVSDIKSEFELKLKVLENLEYFMKQLGSFYAFMGSEYKIRVSNTYNYIDILLFNVEKNCYVVCELKITEEKKEHFGQILVYMKAVDKTLKSPFQNDTEGILITKKNNRLIPIYIENDKLHSREYKLISV